MSFLNTRAVVALVATVVALGANLHAGTVTVNFSESGQPNGTLLDGTSYFAAQGLAFDNDDYTVLTSNPLFLLAGGDGWGIRTTVTAPDKDFGVRFVNGATSVAFDWVAVFSNDFVATVLYTSGTVQQIYHAQFQYFAFGSFQFDAPANQIIDRIRFHDGPGVVGVGRLSYMPASSEDTGSVEVGHTPLPEAAWAGMSLLAALGAVRFYRLRRARD